LWLEQEVEAALSSLFTRDLNIWWHILCCAILLLLWPLIALVLLPLGAWAKGNSSLWDDTILNKSSRNPSSSSKGDQNILRQLQPQRLAVLYHWVAAVLETPVSLVMVVLILIMGVQPRFGYVIESTSLIYTSLAFSLLHLLSFVWDMILCLSLSRSKQQWGAALSWPFRVACAVDGGIVGKEGGHHADDDVNLELQPLNA
jgi:hypothetical protein